MPERGEEVNNTALLIAEMRRSTAANVASAQVFNEVGHKLDSLSHELNETRLGLTEVVTRLDQVVTRVSAIENGEKHRQAFEEGRKAALAEQTTPPSMQQLNSGSWIRELMRSPFAMACVTAIVLALILSLGASGIQSVYQQSIGKVAVGK